jgi:two-component system chemotaxis response regulator CheY
MFSDYVDALANQTKAVFEEMTGNEVLKYEVKKDQQPAEMAPWVHVITYEHVNKDVEGKFILGFADEAMALAVSSALAEKVGLEPISEMDEMAADVVNEFLNTIVGRAISDWDRMGMPVKFSPPQFMKAAKLETDDKVTTKAYEIILNLTFSHVIFRVTFSEESKSIGEGKKAMVVEDSAVIRSIIAKTLTQLGFEVQTAENGKIGVEMYSEFNPDLVLMDLVMPEMGGLEAIRNIKKWDKNSRFIILTSSARRDEVLEAKKLGVRSYLVKPFNPELLIREVAKIFGA